MSSLKPSSGSGSSSSNKPRTPSRGWTSSTSSYSSSTPATAGVGRAGFLRDPSGLLMSIIRTLSASDGDHQREVERERLEEAFAETDEKLDNLISENYEEVAMTIKRFSRIAEQISTSRTRVKKVRENLQQCKSLLYCRQDELRKLWVEGVEYKKVLFLLDQIEKVKVAPHQIDCYLKDKHYLHATVLINQALNALQNQLVSVEAFNDIRNEVMSKKLRLHETFINELHQLIYFKSFAASKRAAASKSATSATKLVELASFTSLLEENSEEIGVFDQVVKSLEDDSKPADDDPKQLMTVLIESLNRIGRVGDMLEHTKARMDRHISMIVSHSTVEVTDQYFNTDGSAKTDDTDGSQRLLQLLSTLFSKFKLVAEAHAHVLAQVNGLVTTGRLQPSGTIYEMETVWAKIQTVLQVLLNEYLDADNVQVASQQQVGFSEHASLSSHFTRKRVQQRPQAAKLFRFDRSSHAISMNNYLREQRAQLRHSALTGGEAPTSPMLEHAMSTQKVCQPNARNITAIFAPLKLFIADIEQVLGYKGGRRCSLHEFITDYIQDSFIRHIQYVLKKEFDNAMKVTDPLKILADPSVCKNVGTTKTLLHGVTIADQCLWYLYDLTCSLDSYHDHFLTMACSLTQEYKEISVQSFRGIVQPDPEHSRLMSADWIMQSEVNEQLRKLESWRLVNGLLPSSTKLDDKPLENSYNNEAKFFIHKIDESSLEIRRDLLLDDISDLRAIACLHESVEWMSVRLNEFIKKVQHQACADTTALLTRLADDYQRLSEECLMTMHVEVRLNCCQRIKTMFRESNFDIRGADSLEPDLPIRALTADLKKVQEHLSDVLESSKFKYITEGVGHLVAALLIDGARYVTRMSVSGIKKMCRNVFSLQQCLTNITLSREAPLDMTRQYYELMYLSPDDIQPHVVEHGVKFNETDYVEALRLIHRSKPGAGHPNAQSARVQRLRSIVSEQLLKKVRQEELSSLDDVEV